jgi:hypothetical protein
MKMLVCTYLGRLPPERQFDSRVMFLVFIQLHRLQCVVYKRMILADQRTKEKIRSSGMGATDQSRFSQGRPDESLLTTVIVSIS